jgi:GntR family transcriptional regulator
MSIGGCCSARARKEGAAVTSTRARDIRPIDHNSPVPYYYQLADILREEIDKGRWAADELIPAEGALTEIFGVSRSVTRKSLDLLEGEGRVLRIKGKGTIVTKPKFSYDAAEAAGTWFSQRPAEVRLGQIISAGRVPAGGHLAKLLGLSTRDEVWEITLTHTLDDVPVSLSHLYLRIQGTLTVSAPPQFETGGPEITQQLATKYGVDITDSQIEIKAAAASEVEAEILKIDEGAAVIQVGSLDFAYGDRVVGFNRTVVVREYFLFAVAVHRKAGGARGRSRSELVTRANQ